MDPNLKRLRDILDDSKYTVVLCGSGMMEEGGVRGVKKSDRAYDIETKYGASPEEIFSSSFYSTRPERFFHFYKEEMLQRIPEQTGSGDALAVMERDNVIQCIITSNIYELASMAGCKNVVALHGSIYNNRCPRCGKEYPMEYIRDAKGIPLCENCSIPVRPLVSLFGEMVDSQKMTKTAQEIEKADTLILLGTNLDSEVFSHYIAYFEGRNLVVIHRRPHYLDHKADLVIVDDPRNVLPMLGYE